MAYETYFDALLAGTLGFSGGILRAIVELCASSSLNMKINWRYWFLTAIIGGVVGIIVGVVFSSSIYFSLLGGYAGISVIKSIKKSFSKQKFKEVKKV